MSKSIEMVRSVAIGAEHYAEGAIYSVSDDDADFLVARGAARLVGRSFPSFVGGVERPPGFNFDFTTYFPWGLWRDRSGAVHHGFDPMSLIPDTSAFNGEIYYLDAAAANDSADGLTEATPKQSMGAIVTLANAGGVPAIVFVKAGTYIRARGWNGGTRFTVPVWVIGYGGRVVFGLHDNATWGVDGTYGSCYSTTTFTTAGRIVDIANLDSLGDYTELQEVATPTLCNTLNFNDGPGYWAQDGSKIYVRRKDGGVVSNSNTRAYRHSVEGARCSASGNTHVFNIDFEGGNNGAFLADGNASAWVYLINSSGKWAGRASSPVDGIKARNVAFMLNYRVRASHNTKDGFNFQESSGVAPVWVNIDCWGYRNGVSTSTSNNGLTPHTECLGLDINGVYEDNYGGDIVAIDEGTQMWCVNTHGGNSKGDLVFGGTNVPVEFEALNGAEIWVDGGSFRGAARNYSASGGGRVRVRNHQGNIGAINGAGVSAY